MKPMENEIRPIVIFGTVLIMLTIFAGLFFFLSPISPVRRPGQQRSFIFLVLGVHMFYFLAGIGVVLRKAWGYYLFKFFLYTQFLAFPVGTIITYVTLSYMRRHAIKRHFGFDIRANAYDQTAVPLYMKVITIIWSALAIALLMLLIWMMVAF